MPSKEKRDGKCNARVKQIPDEWDDDTTGYCMHPEGFRCDDPDAERCYLHGGRSTEGNGGNPSEKHGLYAERQSYYENRSHEEQQWIDAVVESLVDDAPFGPESFAKMQMLRNIGIDMHKLQNANDYVDEVGLVHRDKTVGYTDDGKPIKVDEENAINIAYDRLQKSITRQLKTLGVMSDPDSQKADAQKNIADELAKIRQERD